MSLLLRGAGEDLCRAVPGASRTLAIVPLYLGFAATGVGVALPGALLP